MARIADPFGVHPERVRRVAAALSAEEGAPEVGDLEFASALLAFTRDMQHLAETRPGVDFRTLEGQIESVSTSGWRAFSRAAVWRAMVAGESIDLQRELEAATDYYQQLAEPR